MSSMNDGTVAEIIKLLSQFPPETKVAAWDIERERILPIAFINDVDAIQVGRVVLISVNTSE